MAQRTDVFDHATMQRKLRRIAHQLHEEHHAEDGLVLVGVAPRGTVLAERLATLLRTITELPIELVSLKLDKDAPRAVQVELSVEAGTLAGRTVVLVDDVLMCGRTLMHAA
ncbi:MAG: phosphoribosyltransferase family protein, partial [Flavobacteriales bacterium]|nr:phosphoribosyltransferase family protein [Flavobacteriales bacterium]